jgi:hypothetical protein
MGRIDVIHFRSFLCTLLSFSLIACLVFAPLCAARCASQACASEPSNAAGDACHHSSAQPDSDNNMSATAVKVCASPEIDIASPRTEGLTVSARNSFHSEPISPFVPPLGLLFAASAIANPLQHGPGLASEFSLTTTAPLPLRI